jgi:hypothetical protein
MSITDALRLSLSGVAIDDRDGAAVALAYAVAAELDDGGDVEKLAPKLQAVLETLLLTPRARAAVTTGGTPGESITSPLDELRARRRRRSAPPGDATAGGADT